jgi:putative phosphoesterase
VLIAIISDTHLPRGHRRLPGACVQRLGSADLILHAGDLSRVAVLEALSDLGPPVQAVYGNVDEPALRDRLPAALELDLAGVTVAMTHDAGPAGGRLERLRRRFPSAAAVVFGHSHLPLHETSADGFQIFNPGSPTERRRAPGHTMGVARVGDGRVSFELIDL